MKAQTIRGAPVSRPANEALAAEYLKWHGPNGAADVIPEDFAAAMREIVAGKAVDLDRALKEPPPGALSGLDV